MPAQGWSSVGGATECALAGSEERAHRVNPNGAWCDPLRERDQCDLEAFRASAAGLGPGRGLPADTPGARGECVAYWFSFCADFITAYPENAAESGICIVLGLRKFLQSNQPLAAAENAMDNG